jgi:hypothetical protein
MLHIDSPLSGNPYSAREYPISDRVSRAIDEERRAFLEPVQRMNQDLSLRCYRLMGGKETEELSTTTTNINETQS